MSLLETTKEDVKPQDVEETLVKEEEDNHSNHADSLDNTAPQHVSIEEQPTTTQPKTITATTATATQPNTTTNNTDTPATALQEPVPPPAQPHLEENVRILKEAFPDVDVDIIQVILQSKNDNVESSFETLLGMSDPNYSATTATATGQVYDDVMEPPVMPPRPSSERRLSSDNNDNNSTLPYVGGPPRMGNSVEDQVKLDEEFARQLAIEDEIRRGERRQEGVRQQQQQQQHNNNNNNNDDPIFNFQEELPIIKEKMKEFGNGAKKKIIDFYNQIKSSNASNNSNSRNNGSGGNQLLNKIDTNNASSPMPTTHAQYRGLPSDDGDDLLTGDISALHLSDYDVYAQTGGRQKNNTSNNMLSKTNNSNVDGLDSTSPKRVKSQTSTSDAQLKADEDFAKKLAEQDTIEARRLSTSISSETAPHVLSNRKPTVVIAARSPLEFEGDSDYEDVGLTATAASNSTSATHNNTKSSKLTTAEDNSTAANTTSVPYVIGDDDDSDDDLVDIDDFEDSTEVNKPNEKEHDKLVK